MNNHLSITTQSPADTFELARDLISATSGSHVLALYGQLGSGKTCFVQGIGHALGVRDPITSPTFTLLGEYMGTDRALFHFDLYRLQSPDELWAMGFDEYLARDGIVALEWAERAQDTLPPDTIHIRFSVGEQDNSRLIDISNAPPGLRPHDTNA